MPLKRLRPACLSALASFALALPMACLPVSGVAQTSAMAPVASRLTQRIDESQQIPLRGTVHRLANAANDRGAVDSSLTLGRVEVVLKRSAAQETALRQLIQDMHTPGTASYHKWLTPAQFGEQFGPSDADIATLTSWLSSKGFTVTKVNPGKQTLEFTGNAGQFSNTFHTQIHKYEVEGQIHTANASEPTIPAALAPVFGGFASLNNFHPKSQAKHLGTAQFDPVTHETKPNWTVGGNGSLDLILAPADFAVQYNVNPLYTAGTNGAGQTIGIINDSNISIALVNQFRTLFNLPANPPTVIIDGNDPGIDGLNNPDGPNGDSGEAYIDVEQSGAIAPNATIDLVIAADTTVGSGLIMAAEHAVDSDVAPVLSVSFGNCEGNLGASGNAFLNLLWEQAAAQGQTVMVSTGDSGSASCDQGAEYAIFGQTVSGFASTPYDVAVGGTDFYYSSAATGTGTSITTAEQAQLATYWNLTPSNATPAVSLLTPIPEQPWNDSQYGINIGSTYLLSGNIDTSTAAGSGGASNCAAGVPANNEYTGGTCAGYQKPAWQTGTGVPADGVRDIPDVSLFASNGQNQTFYPFCAADGDCQPVGAGGVVQISGYGGTSVASPAFAGIMALVNQKYGRQGQADYVLYKLAAQFPTAFNDVTVGTNAVPCAVTSPNCVAVANPLTIDDPNYGTAVEGEIGNTTTKTPEYNASAGYDLASGLGTVNATNLVTNWNSITLTPTTTALTLSAAPYAANTAVTVSGTVSGNATGTVEIMTTSTEPLQAGTGNFTVTNGAYSGTVYLPGGTYTVYANYAGNGTLAPSQSTPQTITVGQTASKLTLTALNEIPNQVAATSGSSVTYGTQLLLTATPAPGTGTAGAKPTGIITYTDNGTVIGTEPVSADGTAVLNWAPAVGAHSVTAAYAGDGSYAAATSTAFTLTVTQNTPDLNAYTSGSPSNSFGAFTGTTTLTVQVSNSGADAISSGYYAAASPVAAPTGVVTITGLGSTTLTFPSLQAGLQAIQSAGNAGVGATMGTAATTVPASIAPGNYTVTINYPGDANYSAATVKNIALQIANYGGTATTTTATASAAQTSRTAPLVISGTVTGTTSKGVPTGTIYVTTDGYGIGSVNLGTGSGASAPYSIALSPNADSGGDALTPGVNVITIQYAPASNSPYAPSAATVAVSNGSNAYFTLTNSGPINVAPGASGTSTISVTPTGGFTGAVALSCVVTPAAAASTPTCSIASSASVTGLSPATTTLTLNTSSTTTAGTYVVTVTGTNGGAVFTTSVPVVVSAGVTATPAIALTNSGPINLAAGGASGTSTITVTPAGGFTGAVALTCAVTPTTGTSVPTCSIATSPVTISGTAAATATLTVTSTATSTTGGYTVTVSGSSAGVTTQSTTVAVTVQAANATPSVALSNSGAITVVAGASTGNTSTISVTPGGGFTGPVTLTCAVTPTTGTSAPTCAVTGSPVTIAGTTAGSGTVAITTTATTSAGAYTVTVSGTAAGVTIAPTTLSLTVTAPVTATPTVMLGGGSSITIATAGGSGTSSVSVTPGGGFSGSVSLACSVSSTVSEAPTCSISPSSVALSGTSPGAATLTVNTTAASAALELPRMRMLPIGGGIAAATLLFFLVPMKRGRIPTLLGALVLIAIVGMSAGCGGGGSPTPVNPGTPAGTYNVTVSGTATGVTITPITVSVTVQ